MECDFERLRELTVDTMVLPMLSVVVMTAPPANVPFMVELPRVPEDPEGMAEPLEFMLPPIIPPVGDKPAVASDTAEDAADRAEDTAEDRADATEVATADTVEVPLTTVEATVAVELAPPLTADWATVALVRIVVIRM